MKTWMVICNTSKAWIYDITPPPPAKSAPDIKVTPRLREELSHPESKLKPSELVSDEPGLFSHGRFGPSTNAKEVEFNKFAKQLAGTLEHHRKTNSYHSLIICAEPNFQGLLKQHLSKETKNCIKKFVQKDYVPFPKNELDEIIEELAHETL